MGGQVISRAEHTHIRPDAKRVSRPTSVPTFADNRPQAVALRKLSEALHGSPRLAAQRELAEAMNNRPRVAVQRKPIDPMSAAPAQLQGGPEEEELLQGQFAPVMASQSSQAASSTGALGSTPIQLAKKNKIKRALAGAGFGGVAGVGLGLGAMAIGNFWNPIGWGLAGAGLGALMGGIAGAYTSSNSKPQTIEDMYGYESENLSEEELSEAEEEEDLIRYSGTKNEKREKTKIYPPDIAVKRMARGIRREREERAQDKDRKPFLTRLGSSILEFAPNKVFKDVGAYQTETVTGGGVKRVGKAKPYEQLGRDMDRVATKEKRSGSELDANVQDLLMEREPSHPLAEKDSRKQLAEGAGVLMTDMARGSAGPGLVSNMFSYASSFFNRFENQKGSYRPSWKKGSQYIQDETKKKKHS